MLAASRPRSILAPNLPKVGPAVKDGGIDRIGGGCAARPIPTAAFQKQGLSSL
jgi:hypothetical protein